MRCHADLTMTLLILRVCRRRSLTSFVQDICGKARKKNDGSGDRAIRLKCENQRGWRSAYGNGPVSTDDGVTRLSDWK